jgi:hypothetical protein
VRWLVIALTLALAPPASPPSAVDEILARYAAARGGAERWEKLQAIELQGTFTYFSEEAPFTLLRKRPNHYRFESKMLGKTTVLAYDGTKAWRIYPLYGIEAPAPVTEPDLALLLRDAELEPPLLDARAKGHRVELLGRSEVDGQEALALQVTLKSGRVETWHLDPKSFLEIAIDAKTFDFSQRGEEMAERSFFSDFRVVEGLVLPHRIEKEYGARHTVLAVERIQLNPPLAKGAFSEPAR